MIADLLGTLFPHVFEDTIVVLKEVFRKFLIPGIETFCG